MIESVRARLTVWYVSVLGAVLLGVCAMIYVLLSRALHDRVDVNLRAVSAIAVTSLTNDLAEGQGVDDAARSTSAELFSDEVMLAIYDGLGRLLAEAGRDDDFQVTLPKVADIPNDDPILFTMTEPRDVDDRHRIAVRRARIAPSGTEYIIVAGTDLEAIDEELESLREILFSVVPAALVVAGIVGWFLARKSLAPVMHMAERARRIGVENLGGRLPVANPRDELGRLAATFNELLGRLATSFAQQRQFMADASHELRTPVATARTAAAVALHREQRPEAEYREALQIIEQQTVRMTRLVDDMFTLTLADSGSYPVRTAPLYLDEVVGDVARSARVLAATRGVSIEHSVPDNAPFHGDEELLRRMIANLVDNAVKHAPRDSVVRLELHARDGSYEINVSDSGAGISDAVRPHIFDRFVRADASRRRDGAELGGAGLGLSIVRWVATHHGGDVALIEATGSATTFRVTLPRQAASAS